MANYNTNREDLKSLLDKAIDKVFEAKLVDIIALGFDEEKGLAIEMDKYVKDGKEFFVLFIRDINAFYRERQLLFIKRALEKIFGIKI